MRSYAGDYPKLTPFMTWGLPESEQAFATGWQKWLENMAAHEEYVFLIRHAESLEFMGLCG